MFLGNFLEISWVSHAFKGVKIAVGILILDAGIKMAKKIKKKPLTIVIMTCAFVLMLLVNFGVTNVSSITMMLVAALISVLFHFIGTKTGKEKENK